MSLIKRFLHHPRRLWLRRAFFQVHLWAGILISLYLVLISLSGSVLVFKDELARWHLPSSLSAFRPDREVSANVVISNFQSAHPSLTIATLQFPSTVYPAFLLEASDARHHATRWIADPASGEILPAQRSFLDVVHDMHYYLLLPPAWGMQVNAVGASMLLLLAFSGLYLWWPGVRLWTRGLRVNLHAHWRRITYDLHNALGFWSLAIVLWWSFSGVYFGYYREVTASINWLSPLQGMRAPQPLNLPRTVVGGPASLESIVAGAQSAAPGGHLWSVSDPQRRSPESFVLLDRQAAGDFSHRDIVRVRTADARVLSVWHYGQRHTMGDWALWLMHPLHYGTLWGLAVKVLWATLGLSLAVVTLTGLLMYWNRYLRHALR